jgi:uncharacterized protein YggE
LDLRLLSAVLALIIIGMLAVWQPWEEQAGKKTLTVTGQAVIEEAPDQYVFTPNFTAEAATSAEAVTKVSKKGNEVVAELKKMGISEDQLTTRVDSNNFGGIEPQTSQTNRRSGEQFTAVYYITCKVKDKSLAQKVTDYLAKSEATGGITPRAEFANETRTQLDAQLRQKALQDAKAKAEVEANELGITLGQVVTVSEEPNRGGITPMERKADAITSGPDAPPVLSGTERMTLSITVTYAIK